MVRTRTIREAAVYFQKADQACLTETAIRTPLRTGVVPSALAARKQLVIIVALEAYPDGSVR